MSKQQKIVELFHRSRKRIRDLGEVFTPEGYVDSMLDLLSKGKRKFWDNDKIVFFEPSCGHGNIVLPIVDRRLHAFYLSAKSRKIKNPELYAVANTINTIWAIDIDSKNIEHCRERVFERIISFITTTSGVDAYRMADTHLEFFSHILCAIQWHIHENEALSSLSTPETALANAIKTKMGSAWFKTNEHSPIYFNLTWVEYYKQCDDNDLVPLAFEKAHRYLKNVAIGSHKGAINFMFTKSIFHPTKEFNKSNRPLESVEVGL